MILDFEIFENVVRFFHSHNIWLKDILGWSITIIGIGFASYLAYRSGLKSERVKLENLISEVTQKLLLIPVPMRGNGVSVRIANRSDHPIRGMRATITMIYSKRDVVEPPVENFWFDTYIKRGSLEPLVEGRLSWAIRSDGANPSEINVGAGEDPYLDLFLVTNQVPSLLSVQPGFGQPTNHNIIRVASQEGFGADPERPASVALLKHPYKFWVKIVSGDTKARIWELEFLESKNDPIRILNDDVDPETLREIQSYVIRWREKNSGDEDKSRSDGVPTAQGEALRNPG